MSRFKFLALGLALGCASSVQSTNATGGMDAATDLAEVAAPRDEDAVRDAGVPAPLDAPPTARAEGLPFSPGCPADDPWRWSNPLPQGQTLTAAWAASERDVWAVGVAGTILHFDGSRWSCVPSGTLQDLRTVWGSGPDDVWAAGTGRGPGTPEILRWDGRAWARVAYATGQNVLAIGGTGPSDVWVFSDPLYPALHWDGASWTRTATVGSQSLRALWGSRADDVWAIGFDGAYGIWHWDGSAWNNRTALPFAVRPYPPLLGIWGRSAREVWAVGYYADEPRVIRWDGNVWQRVETPATGPLVRVWGSGERDVWILGVREVLHWDGSAWSTRPVGGTVPELREVGAAVAVSSARDAWFVGQGGQMARWDGERWSESPASVREPLRAVWGASDADVWSVGAQGTALHWDGAAWQRVSSGTTEDLVAVWGRSGRDVWAVGARGTSLRWEGARWSAVPVPGATTVTDGTGGPEASAWLVGRGDRLPFVARWDGARWAPALAGLEGLARAELRAVWAGDGAVWVVGSLPPVVMGEGRPAPTESVALRWDGARWARVATDIPGGLVEVWGASAAEVYAAGPAGVARWDGARWTLALRRGDGDPPIERLRGLDARNVWAVGGNTVQRWDGVRWATTTFRVPHGSFAALWAPDADNLWVVGSSGLIARYAR
jgi:hypothetical protein